MAVAVFGVLALGLSLRFFARRQRRIGWTFGALAGAAFLGWSAVVRYSVVLAAIVLAAGFVSLLFAGAEGHPEAATVPGAGQRGVRHKAAVPAVVAAIVVGAAWALYAFVWLVVGPEGGWTGCNCWAARYNDWQYQVQFLVAVLGAVTVVSSAVGFVIGRCRVPLITGAMALAAVGGWGAFLATASPFRSGRSQTATKSAHRSARETAALIENE